MAGLWDEWKGPDGHAVSTFTIITRPAMEGIAKIHDGMPMVVPPSYYAPWLDKGISESSDLLESCSLDTPPSELDNFDDFPLLRVNEMPAVEVHIVPSSAAPTASANPAFRRLHRLSPMPSPLLQESDCAACHSIALNWQSELEADN